MRKIIIVIIFTILFVILNCSNENKTNDGVIKIYNGNSGPLLWSHYDNLIYFIKSNYYFIPTGEERPYKTAICYIDQNGENLGDINMNNYYFESIVDISTNPDGKYMALSACESEDPSSQYPGYYNIYKVPIEGGLPINLINNYYYRWNLSPTWTSDGQWIYFIRANINFADCSIWKVKPDGSELTKTDINLGDDVDYIIDITFSHNGKYLLISCFKNNLFFSKIISMNSGESWVVYKPVYCEEGEFLAFSPDDKWICIGDPSALSIISTDGKDEPVSIYTYTSPYIKNDDNDIFFYRATRIFPDWSPDGHWIVFALVSSVDDEGIYKVKVPDKFLPN